MNKTKTSLAVLCSLLAFCGLSFALFYFFGQNLSGVVSLSGPRDVRRVVDSIPPVDLVLLGESTHGTHEYYVMRAEISKRLIRQRDVSFIAVEGDWAALYRLNNYVLGKNEDALSAREVVRSFERWPQWMWANEEVVELAEWLRDYNQSRDLEDRVRFYGMDVYGQWEALDRLLEFSQEVSSEFHQYIRSRTECFSRFRPNEWAYAQAVANRQAQSCQQELEQVVELIKSSAQSLSSVDENSYFEALQNAYVLKSSESFYRLSIVERGGPSSWNSRASHMKKTVDRLLKKHDGLGIVWAHNTHVGDARATQMQERGQVNIGQLSRQKYGEDKVFILGFSTYTGQVQAGSRWESPRETMNIPEGVEGSYEDLLNQLEVPSFYLTFSAEDREQGPYSESRPHRAIGVVYNPAQERGNYVPTVLAQRYDGIVFFRTTSGLIAVED